MEAITHLVPKSEIGAETFAQYQLGDSRNIGGIANRRGKNRSCVTSDMTLKYLRHDTEVQRSSLGSWWRASLDHPWRPRLSARH